MNFKAFYERYSGSSEEVSTWYHGTPVSNIPSIKSEGLVPDTKDKAWGEDPNRAFGTPDRTSLGGIYVTSNLMTALSAASQADREAMGHAGLVVMRLQPRTFVLDEDDISRDLSTIPTATAGIGSNLSSAVQYYFLNKYVSSDRFMRVEDSFDKYRESFFLYVERIKGLDLHPKQKERIEELLPMAYDSALLRAAAYGGEKNEASNWNRPFWEVKDEFPDEIPFDDPPEPPSVDRAEKEFREVVNKLTRTLKSMARPVALKREPLSATARVMKPINFRGSNKILAVLEIIPDEVAEEKYGAELPEDMGSTTFIRMRYGERSDLSQDFVEEWRRTQNENGPHFLEDYM